MESGWVRRNTFSWRVLRMRTSLCFRPGLRFASSGLRWAGRGPGERCPSRHLADVGLEDAGKGALEAVETFGEVGFADGQRAEALHHLAAVAGGLNDQTLVESGATDFVGNVTAAALQALHQAAALEAQAGFAELLGNALEPLCDHPGLLAHLLTQLVVRPEFLERCLGGDERVIVTAECSVVFAG